MTVQHTLQASVGKGLELVSKTVFTILLVVADILSGKFIPALFTSRTADRKDTTEYPNPFLQVYDYIVLRWGCGILGTGLSELQPLFEWNVSEEHADIGPGSGYLPCHSKRIEYLLDAGVTVKYTAFDINETPLLYLTNRLTRRFGHSGKDGILKVETYILDISAPADAKRFESSYKTMNMHLLCHCVPPPSINGAPGTSEDKFYAIFQSAFLMLKPGGRLCGSTIMDLDASGDDVRLAVLHKMAARGLINYLREKGMFRNQGDSMDILRKAAHRAGFVNVVGGLHGAIAFFEMEKPL